MKKKESLPEFLYKIVSKEYWDKSQNMSVLVLPPEDDTFIRLAEKGQVGPMLKHWLKVPMIYIMKLDTNLLQGRLVKEKEKGGTTEYYHLYEGVIPWDAVMDLEVLSPKQNKD